MLTKQVTALSTYYLRITYTRLRPDKLLTEDNIHKSRV